MDARKMMTWLNPATRQREEIGVPETDESARRLLRGARDADALIAAYDEYRKVFKKSIKESLMLTADEAQQTASDEAQERQRRFNEERDRRRRRRGR